ncbi:major facilitator superfamily domain-containing protein [Apodospora peruviana]|uniref:Major facilitator superfamily domain-containing protein n=1 Tax=Apodospora peruviana TaxID=516989 RepID=A0AAE0IAV8_9PEZI|nr:major facilitator superfamily domain-containing protein [Apodospora peruviana]
MSIPPDQKTEGGGAGTGAAVDEITPAPDHARTNSLRDKATEFLASHGAEDVSFTYEEEKAVLRRIDFRVLSLLLGAYFFQQLDKSSLSYVSIFGISEDAHLVGKQYSWLGSILYLAQLVMQPLAAFILVKLPTGKVIATAIFLWGSSLAIMSSCTTFSSLLGLRFVLGSFEAMIAPSCVAVTQMWWRRSEQTLRTSYWNAMNGVTFIVGSLFTYGLGHIQSSVLFRYQIVFLFCGLLTVVYAVVVLILMPDSPMEAKYLNEREKVIAVERLRANQMGVASREWRWDHVWETLLDFKTWCWFIAIIAISIASGGIGTFGNLIIRDFGYSPFESILFNIPFGVIQIVAIIGSGWLATRFQRKGLVITGVAVLPCIGAIMMLAVPRTPGNKGVLLFGYYLVSCMAAITPLIYAWQAQNTGGDTKKKCTSAMVFIGMCTGNVIGPLLYSVDHAPLYRPGLIANLIMFALVGVISAIIPIYLMFLNRRHAKRREELGKNAQIVDESMMGKNHIENSKAVEIEAGHDEIAGQRHRKALEEDNALRDMTDLKNEDFIYVY